MSNQKLIPELRFPEFENEGEWVEKTIGEIAPFQRGFDLLVDNIVVGDYPVVFSNGILKYHNEFKVKAPGVVTGRSGTIGKVTYVEKDFWPHNTSLWVTDFCGNFPLFIFYYYVQISLEQFSAGGGVPTLNRNDVHKYNISVPKSIQEQQKIASCLSSLDEVIAAHSQKLALLKDHKKGLMQNLFPQAGEKVPRYRFKEFEEDGEWVEKTLGEVAKFVNEKTSLENLSINNYISTENLLPEYAGVVSASKLPASGNFTKYKEEDILISNIRPYLKKVWYSDKQGGCSNDVFVVRAKSEINKVFLSFLLKNDDFINYVMIGAKGVKMPRGDKDLISKHRITFPNNKSEQQKIASCLSSLDALITAQAEQIAQLKLHKKGLMQGLFPKIKD